MPRQNENSEYDENSENNEPCEASANRHRPMEKVRVLLIGCKGFVILLSERLCYILIQRKHGAPGRKVVLYSYLERGR